MYLNVFGLLENLHMYLNILWITRIPAYVPYKSNSLAQCSLCYRCNRKRHLRKRIWKLPSIQLKLPIRSLLIRSASNSQHTCQNCRFSFLKSLQIRSVDTFIDYLNKEMQLFPVCVL